MAASMVACDRVTRKAQTCLPVRTHLVSVELKKIRNLALRNRVKGFLMTKLCDVLDSEQVTLSGKNLYNCCQTSTSHLHNATTQED